MKKKITQSNRLNDYEVIVGNGTFCLMFWVFFLVMLVVLGSLVYQSGEKEISTYRKEKNFFFFFLRPSTFSPFHPVEIEYHFSLLFGNGKRLISTLQSVWVHIFSYVSMFTFIYNSSFFLFPLSLSSYTILYYTNYYCIDTPVNKIITITITIIIIISYFILDSLTAFSSMSPLLPFIFFSPLHF